MKKAVMIIPVFFLLLACGRGEEGKIEIVKKPRPVRYTVVETEDKGYQRTFSGNVISEIESKLSFRVEGTIENKYFKVGDYIQEGEVIARLDDKDYRLTLEGSLAQYEKARAAVAEAEAGLKSAEASLINAENEFSRMEKLYYNDNVSKSDYDSAKAERDVSEAQTAQAEAGMRSALAGLKAYEMQVAQDKLNLEYTKLTAPRQGFIVSEDREVNETVSAGTSVYTISLGERTEVETFISENLIGSLTRGQEVEVEVSAVPGKKYHGVIKEVGASSTGYGMSYPLKIALKDRDSRLKPGMSARVSINFSQEETGIIVPIGAVDQDASGNSFVFILTDVNEGTAIAKKTLITTGKTYSKGVAVPAGIKPGDYLVSSGVTQVMDGQRVSLYSEEGR